MDLSRYVRSQKNAGVIEKWHKKEGDLIKRDEVICDIRTEVIIPVCLWVKI